MTHKVNPHNLRVGIIRDWESRWNANDVSINGDNFKNLSIADNVKVLGNNKGDIKRIVKTMKKR